MFFSYCQLCALSFIDILKMTLYNCYSNVEMLVAKIFRFLVHLSYEKNHSKPVISVAKVIQLCDGLMASGQNPLTHCESSINLII